MDIEYICSKHTKFFLMSYIQTHYCMKWTLSSSRINGASILFIALFEVKIN